MIIKNFNLQALQRETVNGKRHYCTPDGKKLPSVTTILDLTKPQEKREALANWKKRVGEQKAQEIVTEAAGVGTAMHKMLENYCLGQLKPPGTNLVQQQAHKMAHTVIANGLHKLTECWGNEAPLYYEELYAGSTDCLGLWDNKPAILDFKQTNKPKKREWIEDYFLQLAAYGNAFTKMTGIEVKTGVILMCSRNLEYQEFVITGDEYDEWTEKWWNRVWEYYNLTLP